MKSDPITITGDNVQVSDGYHTFAELYDHRITLYIALCKATQDFEYHGDARLILGSTKRVWRSRHHSDGEMCFGTGTWFILGINREPGQQITYHIPAQRWDETDFAETLGRAPKWDGHTSAHVLERLKNL